MFRLLSLLFLVLLPVATQAGPWPREKRSLFLAFSNSISAKSDTAYATGTSLYLEYGLTSRLTVGVDAYLGPTGDPSEGYLFLQFPIGKTNRPSRMALSFALGQKSTPNPWGTTTNQSFAKIGAAWGRGLKNGWLAVDTYVTAPLNQPDIAATDAMAYSADFTWGIKPSDRLMLIWQLQTGKPAIGETYIKFAPSLIWSIGKKSNQIEIGIVTGLYGDDSRNLKLGLWKTF